MLYTARLLAINELITHTVHTAHASLFISTILKLMHACCMALARLHTVRIVCSSQNHLPWLHSTSTHCAGSRSQPCTATFAAATQQSVSTVHGLLAEVIQNVWLLCGLQLVNAVKVLLKQVLADCDATLLL